MDSVVLGAVGVRLVLDTDQGLSNATTMEIHVVKPDGTTAVWDATASETPECIEYTTIEGDLAVAGQYYLHAYVEWDIVSKHTGEAVVLDVCPAPPVWSTIKAVRLELGKGPSVDLLDDEEISYFLVRASNNTLLAASFAAESLAGYYADRVDKSIGSRSISNSQKAEAWRKKAEALRSQVLNSSFVPRASSGTAQTLKFGIGQHDNPSLSSSGSVVGDEQI